VFEQIGPNGTYTYDFIAEPAGALANHCHVPPVMQHVRMGLYGAFIVYPKTPLPPAREYVLVNGEYDTQNQLNLILETPTFKVQSWELASGNTAILEVKWPWPGKFTSHYQ
jgi:nitrite reductase (NO-forming)